MGGELESLNLKGLNTSLSDHCAVMISRSRFATQMDRKSKFFHAMAKSKKRKKKIEALKINGRCYRGKEKIMKEVQRFFKSLYTEEEHLDVDFDKSLVAKPTKEDSGVLERIPDGE
ncbi:hypothetical protein PIB30_026154 [Stylosanthes scabra]|uniref:Uncharacterized protein n=1 Tax=Stylosanthes scabra TaxID=79078 RepID=A0ABU6V8G8_9FABA|nr:hypothetical protein [Stylosanthes scabra]